MEINAVRSFYLDSSVEFIAAANILLVFVGFLLDEGKLSSSWETCCSPS